MSSQACVAGRGDSCDRKRVCSEKEKTASQEACERLRRKTVREKACAPLETDQLATKRVLNCKENRALASVCSLSKETVV